MADDPKLADALHKVVTKDQMKSVKLKVAKDLGNARLNEPNIEDVRDLWPHLKSEGKLTVTDFTYLIELFTDIGHKQALAIIEERENMLNADNEDSGRLEIVGPNVGLYDLEKVGKKMQDMEKVGHKIRDLEETVATLQRLMNEHKEICASGSGSTGWMTGAEKVVQVVTSQGAEGGQQEVESEGETEGVSSPRLMTVTVSVTMVVLLVIVITAGCSYYYHITQKLQDLEKVAEKVEYLEKVARKVEYLEKVAKKVEDLEKVAEKVEDLETVAENVEYLEKLAEKVEELEKVEAKVQDLEQAGPKMQDLEERVAALIVGKHSMERFKCESGSIELSPSSEIKSYNRTVKFRQTYSKVPSVMASVVEYLEKVAEKVEDLEKVAEKVEDLEKVAEKVEDLEKVAEKVEDLETVAEKVQDLEQVGPKTQDLEERVTALRLMMNENKDWLMRIDGKDSMERCRCESGSIELSPSSVIDRYSRTVMFRQTYSKVPSVLASVTWYGKDNFVWVRVENVTRTGFTMNLDKRGKYTAVTYLVCGS